jgi:PAS domain S-box-containing protein
LTLIIFFLVGGMSNDRDRSLYHLAALVESAADAIVAVSLEGEIVFWNRGAQNIYGYSAREVIGKNFADLVDPKATQLTSLDWSLSNTETSQCILAEHKHRDGRAIDVIITISAIQDPIGEIIGKSIIAKTFPDTNICAENPQEAMSAIAHEFRTPLTSIKGALGLLLTGKLGNLSDRGQRMLEIAVSNIERLSRLLNDFLDLQRIKADRSFLDLQTGNIVDLMQEAAEVMQFVAGETGIEIVVSQTPIVIAADRDRLIQLVINLLSNAIKFSPPKSEISVSATLETGSPPTVLLKVSDRGRGIPRDKLELIFESFQQVDPADAREKQGTGLGLAICRSIVHQHQGEIWVESQLGMGSTFYVRLPVKGEER